MLLNDHLFKTWWPGWWTGKLSDAAWALFFPFFVALAASLLIPRTFKKRDNIALWTSLVIAGAAYGLFNSWDPFHTLVNSAFTKMFGWGQVERDPTDSVALVVLGVSRWIWWRPVTMTVIRSRAVVVAILATLATIATSPIPTDVGISCLRLEGT